MRMAFISTIFDALAISCLAFLRTALKICAWSPATSSQALQRKQSSITSFLWVAICERRPRYVQARTCLMRSREGDFASSSAL